MERAARMLMSILFVLAVSEVSAQDDEESPGSVLWRFDFDNDVIAQSDDLFSAGWSIQRHVGAASWDNINLWRISEWITGVVPGISGGSGMEVRKGIGLSQIIQTPGDLTQTALITNDVPYAGALGIANSYAALNNKKMNVFQIYLGVLGPPSLAEQVQTFVHSDLNMGTDPMGWDNQLDAEPLINLNYALIRKMARFGEAGRGFSGDLSYGGGAALGNLWTAADVGLQGRLGWKMSEGFVEIPDVAGRGVITDPVFNRAKAAKTQVYVSLTARGTVLGYTVLLDGNTFKDSHSVDYDPYISQLILGTHLTHKNLGVHFSIYLSSNPVDDTTTSDVTWSNFSIDYRF